MRDTRHLRISRELFLAAFGLDLGAVEPWVTDRLTSLLEEEDVRAGETLFSAGDPPDFFYFMREGAVDLIGAGLATRVLDGRGVLGAYDVLLDRPHSRTAVARTDLQLMKVRSDAWIDLLEDSFELARAAVVSLARTVTQLEERSPTAVGEHPLGGVRARQPQPGELDIIERLALLKEHPMLCRAGVQTLSDLAAVSDEVIFEVGDSLLTRGVVAERIYLLVDGEVEAVGHEPRILRREGPGDIVCGAAAFVDGVRDWEAHALRRTRSLAFRFDDLFDLMEEHFDMVRSVLVALSLSRERLLDALAATANQNARNDTVPL